MIKFIYSAGVVFFFALKCFSSGDVTLSITSKCRASLVTYHCGGTIKFDPANLPLWKKDSVNNYYVYTGPTENFTFGSHNVVRNKFLDIACNSYAGGYQLVQDAITATCTQNYDEQEISFRTKSRTWSVFCNANGRAELLKAMSPTATWVEVPKMPSVYRTENAPPEAHKTLDMLGENLPEGCRSRTNEDSTSSSEG